MRNTRRLTVPVKEWRGIIEELRHEIDELTAGIKALEQMNLQLQRREQAIVDGQSRATVQPSDDAEPVAHPCVCGAGEASDEGSEARG